jgi:hypothetical protein
MGARRGCLSINIDFGYSPGRYQGQVTWKDWTKGPNPRSERISIEEAEGRLRRLAQEAAQGKIRIMREYRPWTGQAVGDKTHWEIVEKTKGGAPKKKLAYIRPPPEEIRPKIRVFLHRKEGNQEVWIDPKFDMMRNLMTVVQVAGLPDPSIWNICDNNGRTLTRTEELTADRVIHLRGKLEIEIDDRSVRFEVQEDEPTEVTFHHLLRKLGISQESWQIVDLHGEIVTEAEQLLPGRKYFAVQKDSCKQITQNPLMIQVHFKLRRQEIPVFSVESFENVLLAIELALNVPGEWKLYDQNGVEVVGKDQLAHRKEYWVKKKESKALGNLIRTDDRTVYLKNIQEELMQIQRGRVSAERERLTEEGSVRMQRWKSHLKEREAENTFDLDQLEEIQKLRKFTPPPRPSKKGSTENLIRAKRNQTRRMRKQKQKGIIRTMKQEQADTTTLQYKAQVWTTKEFARAEMAPDLLSRSVRE